MKKTYSEMTMTEATQATNALRDTLQRGNIHINDSQVLRLAQLNFAPESNEVKMLLNYSTTVTELFEEIEKLPQVETNFDRHTQIQEQQELASRKFNERMYG